MLKIVGMFLIILSSSAVGFSVSKGFTLRTKGIKSIITSFEILKAEIVFKRENLQSVLKGLSTRSTDAAALFFAKVQLCLETEKFDLDKAVDNACCTLRECKLKKEEISEIENSVKMLGKYDADSQCEMLSCSLERLKGIHEKAQLDEQKSGKIFKTLGVAVGLLLSLLLL